MLGPTAHTDTFSRDNLPPPDQWPDFRLDGLDYPEHVNAAVELTDRMVERGFGDRTALVGHGRRRTYKELADWSNRLALALRRCQSALAAPSALRRRPLHAHSA